MDGLRSRALIAGAALAFGLLCARAGWAEEPPSAPAEDQEREAALHRADELSRQAKALYGQGKYAEATPLARESLTLREKALKRGGGQAAIPINGQEAERLCGPDLSASSPEAAFERSFAQAVITRAFAALREEHRARGMEEFFATLAPFLDGTEPEGTRPLPRNSA